MKHQIRYAIYSGRLTEGQMLPSIREVTAKLKVNRNTVHRVYLELAYGPLTTSFAALDDEVVDQALVYGPSAQAGYQLVATGGFTLHVSLGYGYARWDEYDVSCSGFTSSFGLGYSWR